MYMNIWTEFHRLKLNRILEHCFNAICLLHERVKTKREYLYYRFLALPCLLHAPRDQERVRDRLPPRRIFAVQREVLGGRHVAGTPLAVDLDYSEDYRRELARAHSEVFLVRDLASPLSLLHHRPLRLYRDPVKILKATDSCNGQDPVAQHLNPLLQQLGIPLM